MFKVGDKVTLKSGTTYRGLMNTLTVYTVVDVSNNPFSGQGPHIAIDHERYVGWLFQAGCFQLAEKTPRERAIELVLAVLDGDEVKCGDTGFTRGSCVDYAATCIEVVLDTIQDGEEYTLKSECEAQEKEQKIEELESSIKESQESIDDAKKKLEKLKAAYGG